MNEKMNLLPLSVQAAHSVDLFCFHPQVIYYEWKAEWVKKDEETAQWEGAWLNDSLAWDFYEMNFESYIVYLWEDQPH